MIPAPYTTIAAGIFLVGGLLTCFAGFRLFRVVLAIYGFFLGAMVASGMTDPSNTWAVAMYGLVGGLAGAVLMVVAYFVGVGLVGAGLAAIAVNFIWRFVGGDPPTLALVIACVIGAILALNVVRYVVIFGSAIGGAWTAIVGGLALMGNPSSLKAASAPGVWVVYPIDMLPRAWWVYALWIGGTLAGVLDWRRRRKVESAKKAKW